MMLIKERLNIRRLLFLVSVVISVQIYRNVANCEDSRSMLEFRRDLYRKDDGENGIESEPIEYGEAAFYARLELDKKKACEGALIKTNYVLTVATAAQGHKTATVWLGLYILEDYQGDHLQTCQSRKIIVHPGYQSIRHKTRIYPSYITNDIALIRLECHVQITKWVTPVLWPSQLSRKQMCNGNRLQFYQWTEQKSEDSCVNNKYLHRFDLDYLPNEECEKLIDPKLTILPSFICASSTRYKTFCSYCRYGSPLVITLENDQHIIIGLMFARRGSEHLLVFTQVFEFSTWVRGVIDSEKELDKLECEKLNG